MNGEKEEGAGHQEELVKEQEMHVENLGWLQNQQSKYHFQG